jgi:hypothetical protein
MESIPIDATDSVCVGLLVCSVSSQTSMPPSDFEINTTPGRVGLQQPLVNATGDVAEVKIGFDNPSHQRLKDDFPTDRMQFGTNAERCSDREGR